MSTSRRWAIPHSQPPSPGPNPPDSQLQKLPKSGRRTKQWGVFRLFWGTPWGVVFKELQKDTPIRAQTGSIRLLNASYWWFIPRALSIPTAQSGKCPATVGLTNGAHYNLAKKKHPGWSKRETFFWPVCNPRPYLLGRNMCHTAWTPQKETPALGHIKNERPGKTAQRAKKPQTSVQCHVLARSISRETKSS